MSNVLVFRTNINTAERVYRAACRLCILLRGNCRWSVDRSDGPMEDCDCVLRIETETLTEADIIRLLKRAGPGCDILN